MNNSSNRQKLTGRFAALVIAFSGLAIDPQISTAQLIASDNAGNPSYTTAFVGVDGGTGFQAWTAATPSGGGGNYLGATGLAGARTFGIYSGDAGTMNIYRKFDAALAAGQTFSLDLGYTGVNSGGGVIGINLYSGGTWRLNFEFAGGSSLWRVKDNNAAGAGYDATGITWAGGTGWDSNAATPELPGATLNFAFTRGSSLNQYKLDISQGTQSFTTGTTFYTTGTGSGDTNIDEIEIYSVNQGNNQNVGFNNLQIIPEPSSASLIGLGAAGLLALRRIRKA